MILIPYIILNNPAPSSNFPALPAPGPLIPANPN
jgi:hypothetical protein